MAAASHKGLELGSFLSRPVKISELTWDGPSLTTTGFNPWELFLENPAVARKLANFKLLRGSLHIKFVINGNPFLFGRVLAYYNPLPGKDDFLPENSVERLTRISQRQKVQLNPTSSSGGEMVLPFFWYYNAVNIPKKEWRELGNISMLPITSLQSASGTPVKCDVSVFAWMDNVDLMQTTSSTVYDSQSRDDDVIWDEMSDEKSQKVVSKTATAVGDVADAMSNVPIIGPYAKATGIVAKKLGRIADLFGFSKPGSTFDLSEGRSRHLGSLATINDKDTARMLTLDVHNELTIDPRTVGLGPEDELSIPYLCQKEAMIARFKWNYNDSPGTELFRIPVTPFLAGNFSASGRVDLPPCAYVASFFQYWRGSMKYRFEVHACNFHRGKLRFRYEPYKNSNDGYNTVQSEIVDLTTTHDYGFDVGWGAHVNNLQTYSNSSPYAAMVNTDPVESRHNGVIIVSVENSLTVPDEDGPSEIDVIVSLSTGDDIQFHVPNTWFMRAHQIINDVGTPVIPDPTPPAPGTYTQPSKLYGDTRIGAYYYGWYTGPDFNGPYLRSFLKNSSDVSANHLPWVKPRTPEEYICTQFDVVAKQFTLMYKAGIDFVVCSWWGAGSRTDNHFNDFVMQRTGDLVSTEGFWMRGCIHYECGELKDLGGGWNYTAAVAAQVATDVAKMKTYMADPNKYLYRDGKPVIFLYLYRSMSTSFLTSLCTDIRNIMADTGVGGTSYTPYLTVDQMFGTAQSLPNDRTNLIDCLTTYDVYGQTSANTKAVLTDADVQDYHKEMARWATLNPSVDTITCISPGYNDRGVRPEANHVGQARYLEGYEHGSLLKAHLTHFNNETPSNGSHWLVINSWNEWQEDSQIEPVKGDFSTDLPTDRTSGNTYESYETKYVNIVGNYMNPSYVAQSRDGDVIWDEMSGEIATNEANPEMTVMNTMMEKQWTYGEDDAVFFGETNGSLRGPLKRYQLHLKQNTTSSGKNTFELPQFPMYETDMYSLPNTTFFESFLNRVGVMFHARRGSTRWKVLQDFHNTTPRVGSVRLTDRSIYSISENVSSNEQFVEGWSGMDAVTGVYNPVLEWVCPRYSNRRFDDARSVGIADVSERGHIHTYDTSAVYRNYYLLAGGDDLQFFYFAGTPSFSIRSPPTQLV